MADSPTIVVAQLSDDALKKSINSLVNEVNTAVKGMATNFDTQIKSMEERIKALGNIKVDMGKVIDTSSIDKAASDLERKMSKRTLSFDKMAQSQQIAISSKDTLTIDTMNTQLQILSERLTEARQKYSSFVIMSSQASTTGDKGLFQFATQGVQQYEQEAKNLIVQMRVLKSNIEQIKNVSAPQGHAFENYVNSIGKANSTLALLNEQYRNGTSELQKQGNLVGQLIQNINSAKSAKGTFEQISVMPTNSLEEAKAKLQALEALKEKIANTPLLSNAKYNQLNQALEQTRMRVEAIEKQEGKLANSASFDAMQAQVQRTIQLEQQRRESVMQTGLAAQQTYRGIIEEMKKQLDLDTKTPIMGAKELYEEIQKMTRAYWTLDKDQRESPIGRSLKEDIDKAQTAFTLIKKYNQEALGITTPSNNSGANVATLDKTIGSYQRLSELLKDLTEKYRAMGREERNAAEGTQLADRIQRVSREVQKAQQQMSRPVSLSKALGLSERTLDDISYKIRQLQAYKGGIDLMKPGSDKELVQVDNALKRLQKTMDSYMSKGKQMTAMNNTLARSWNYMKNRLAFYFTIGASTAFVKNLIEVRAQYEMNERALGILIGSAERGTQVFKELSQMSLVSPYTLIELSTAAKQLTAFDIAAKDVVDTTRRLADMSAAVGIPIERLTYALGQIKAYGYLNSRDARMFSNAGIPLVKQLAEYYTQLEGKMVSVSDIYDRMKKKAIGYNDVMEVVNKMTDEGGKFFDFQAKMADTLKVRLANLTLAWNNMLNDIGKETQGFLTWTIGALRKLFLHWKDLDAAIKNAAMFVGVAALVRLLAVAKRSFMLLNKQMAWNIIVGKKLSNIIFSIARGIKALASSKATWIAVGFLAAVDAVSALHDAITGTNEAQQELNKSIREGAKNNYDNIKQFLEEYEKLRSTLTKKETFTNANGSTEERVVPVDIDKNEAKKMWEAIREQIEISTTSSDEYISKLLTIENVSERVRQGFAILEDVNAVNAALKELDDDTIELTRDYSKWWNLWLAPDGLIENLDDVLGYLNKIKDEYGSIEEIRVKKSTGFASTASITALKNYEDELEVFKKDLKVTTDSILKFIENKDWSQDVNKISQVFSQITKKIIEENQLDPSKAFFLQTYIEEARAKAVKNALIKQNNDIVAAWRLAEDEKTKKSLEEQLERVRNELDIFDKTNGRSRIEWERFTKWLKEQHISETSAMFRNMDAEQIKSLNFQEGKYGQFIDRMVEKYAKEFKMSTDDVEDYLQAFIRNANSWSITIPVLLNVQEPTWLEKDFAKRLPNSKLQVGNYETLSAAIDDWQKQRKEYKEELERLAKAGISPTVGSDADIAHYKEIQTSFNDVTDALKAYNAELEKSTGKGKKQEDIVAEALKTEISLINEMRSNYEKLRKAGYSSIEAINLATEGYEATIDKLNVTLRRFGITAFNATDFAGKNVKELLDSLETQRAELLASGKVKLTSLKDLDLIIKKLTIDAKTYDMKKITDGLNNELNKLKEEYELSVALDAEPELGDTFASLFGINTDELPHTFEDLVKKAQKAVNDLFEKEGGFEKFGLESIDVEKLLDKKTFDEWVTALSKDASSDFIKSIENVRKYLVDSRRKDIEETAKEWSKLLEKYAEYEFKRKQIFDEYEKEMAIARKKNASEEILTAIANRRDSRLAELDLNEFMKTPEWITATGNLAGMSKKAIGLLIDEINEYKNTAKYLTPKQIKQLNQALKQLHAEQRKNSPFKSISNMLAEAKERADNFEEEIKKTKKTIDELESKRKGNIADGVTDDETDNALQKAKKRLEDLIKKKKELGKPDSTEWVNSINDVISAVQNAVKVVDDLVKAIGGVNNSDVDKVFSIITQAGQGAAIGAQIGGGWGAVIGGVIGAATGIISSIANSYNEDINNAIKASEDRVKSLEIAYIDLDHAINDAYGDAVIGAKRATIANKELQLTELKRQLQLEKSRKAKDRDNDKIRDLQTQIRELEWDIRDAINDIVNDILGISSVGDFAENLVSSMIEAFKNGEDYMKVFGESFDDMIDNMIMKAIASRVIGDLIQKIFDEIKERKVNTISGGKVSGKDLLTGGMENTKWANAQYDMSLLDWITLLSELSAKGIKGAEESLAKAQKMYHDSLALTVDDVDDVREIVSAGKDDVKSIFEAMMEAFGIKYGQNTDKNLSNLQQGIQSITEDTAGAIEAYLNGVSQQVYLHSELLTQIRDTLTGFDFDVQLGVMSQILLQLQSSYQVQMSIQNTLQGVLNPSGRAFNVELIS